MSVSSALVAQAEDPAAVRHLDRSREPPGGERAIAAGRVRPMPIAALALCATVAFTPLPYGSNSPTALALSGLVLALGLGCASTAALTGRNLAMMGAVAVLAAAFLGVVALQSFGGRWGADPVWRDMSATLGIPASPLRTVVRWQPFFSLGNMLCGLAAVVLGIVVGAERRDAQRVLDAFAWSGLCYAIYGIVSTLSDPTTLLWRERDDYLGAVLGPFVNRNTAATYFGCCATVWTLRLSAVALEGGPRKIAGAAAALATCVAALLMTTSRAGVLLGLAGMAAAAGYMLRHHLAAMGRRAWLAGCGVFVALAAVALSAGATGQRFARVGFSDEGRVAVYRAVLRLIADHPLLGTGLGTFPWAYPTVRAAAPGMRNIWDKAHSTPLELAAEVGIPLTAMVACFVLVGLAVLANGVRVRRRDKIVPLAALCTVSIALLHSCTDFSLQIPGVSVVLFGLVGVGLAQSFPTRRPRVARLRAAPVDANPAANGTIGLDVRTSGYALRADSITAQPPGSAEHAVAVPPMAARRA